MFWTRPVDLEPFINTPGGAEDDMISTDKDDSRCVCVCVCVCVTGGVELGALTP